MKKILSAALALAAIISMVVIAGPSTRAAKALPEGVLYYWGFENDSDVTAVEQLKRENGPEGSSAYEIIPSAHKVSIAENQGAVGNALFLDGTYGIKLNDLQPLGEDVYTISFWMSANPIPEYAPIVEIGTNLYGHPLYKVCWMNFLLSPQDNENLNYGPTVFMHAAPGTNMPGGYITLHAEKPEPYQAGDWKMITLVVDGEHFVGKDRTEHVGTKLYIDGKLAMDATAATESELAVMPSMMSFDGTEGFIGINYNDGYFTGYVDELYIFKTALDEEGVAKLFAAGNPPKVSQP